MPQILNYVNIEVTDGVNYVINAADNSLEYYINGTEALTSNWAVTMGAGSVAGMQLHMKYGAVVTLAGNHIFILGTQIPDGLADKDFDVFGFYNGSDWEISFLPDFQDSSIIGTANILDDAVTNDKLAKMLRGTVKVGGVSDAPTDLVSSISGNILIGDGTDIKSLAVTGDVGITGAGLTTIVADAVDNTKLANMVRGTVKVGGVANAPTDLVASTNAQILIGNGTDLVSVPVTGDVTITNAGVTTVNPALLPTVTWEAGTGANSVQTIGTGCDAGGIDSVAAGTSSVTAGISSIALGSACNATGSESISIGSASTSSGANSTTIGLSCIASQNNATSIGYLSSSTNVESVSIGSGCISSAHTSVAIGNTCTAKSVDALAIGSASVANIANSIAFGGSSINALGDCQKIDTILRVATTNNVADEMQLGDGSDGIAIPTDCTANIDIRVVAVQTAGAAGTVGDSFMQNIKLCAKNIAGVSSVVTHNGATLANYSVVAGDVLYELSSCDAAFGGTVVASVSANKLHITVTGENNKDIQWVAYVSLVWTGYRNFSI